MYKIIGVLAVVGLILSQSAFVVPEWEQVIILEFGRPIKTIRDPGLYFKYPFIQDIVEFEKRIMVADGKSAEYITMDKKRVIVDSVSRWRITDPLEFYQTVKIPKGATARLNDFIFGHLRDEVAVHDFKDLIREVRETIMQTVTKKTAERAARFGIAVVDVRIRRLDLPNEVQNSVFARMKAERERIAKRYRAEGDEKAREIRSGAEKEKEIILAEAYRSSQALQGEGDAEAASIYAQAYSQDEEFFAFVRHLEVYKTVFPTGSTVLLRPDSGFLKYLDSPVATEKTRPTPRPSQIEGK
ncbi:MAG: protease modulator HflC [Pseudomonadota bacterium]